MSVIKLDETFSFGNHILTESAGKLYLVGKVQQTTKNRNGRRYGESMWDALHDDPDFKEKLDKGLIVGGVGHPKDGLFDPMMIATTVRKHWREGTNVFAKREIVPTPSGNYLTTLYRSDVFLGTSSRGRGDSKNEDGVIDVLPGFVLEGYDDVIEPSVKDAYTKLVKESLNESVLPFKLGILENNIIQRMHDKQISSEELAFYESFCKEYMGNGDFYDRIKEDAKPKPHYRKVEDDLKCEKCGASIKEGTKCEKCLKAESTLKCEDCGAVIKEGTKCETCLQKSKDMNELESLKSKFALSEQRLKEASGVISTQRVEIATLKESVKSHETTNLQLRTDLKEQYAVVAECKNIIRGFNERLSKLKESKDSIQESLDALQERHNAARRVIAKHLKDHPTVEEGLDIKRDELMKKVPESLKEEYKGILSKCVTETELTTIYNNLVEMSKGKGITINKTGDEIVDEKVAMIEKLDPLVRSSAKSQLQTNSKTKK